MRSMSKQIGSKYSIEVSRGVRRRVAVKAAGESDGHHNESKISMEQAIDSFMHFASSASAEELLAATEKYVGEQKIDTAYMTDFSSKLEAFCSALKEKYGSTTEDSNG